MGESVSQIGPSLVKVDPFFGFRQLTCFLVLLCTKFILINLFDTRTIDEFSLVSKLRCMIVVNRGSSNRCGCAVLLFAVLPLHLNDREMNNALR